MSGVWSPNLQREWHSLCEFGAGTEDGDILCKGAWHGECYHQHPKDQFPVLQVWDLDKHLLGPETLEEEDPRQFRWAREGDHLMCPFQCNQCHFMNIQKRRLGVRAQDEVLLMCICCWANLDAFWSRERATVMVNQREVIRVQCMCAHLGIEEPYPARGPFEVVNNLGMMIACQSLLRSLDWGKNTEAIQFKTMHAEATFALFEFLPHDSRWCYG